MRAYQSIETILLNTKNKKNKRGFSVHFIGLKEITKYSTIKRYFLIWTVLWVVFPKVEKIKV